MPPRWRTIVQALRQRVAVQALHSLRSVVAARRAQLAVVDELARVGLVEPTVIEAARQFVRDTRFA